VFNETFFPRDMAAGRQRALLCRVDGDGHTRWNAVFEGSAGPWQDFGGVGVSTDDIVESVN
jgi:hypothetical protein